MQIRPDDNVGPDFLPDRGHVNILIDNDAAVIWRGNKDILNRRFTSLRATSTGPGYPKFFATSKVKP
jgi:hypothetical protein